MTGFESFKDLYVTDPQFGPILHKDLDGFYDDYSISDGFLFRGVQLCILESSL